VSDETTEVAAEVTEASPQVDTSVESAEDQSKWEFYDPKGEVQETAPDTSEESSQEVPVESGGEGEEIAEAAPEKVFTQQDLDRHIDKRVRRFKETEEQLAEALERLRSLEPQTREPVKAPEIPPMPDAFDDQFEAKVKARDAAIAEHAKWQVESQLSQQQAAQQAEQEQLQQQQRLEKSQAAYLARAESAKITPEQLERAGNLIGSDISMTKAMGILDHSKGPEITMYLARNPEALEALSKMSDFAAGNYMAQEIVPKLSAKPKPSAPDPAPRVKSGSAGKAPNNVDYGRWEVS